MELSIKAAKDVPIFVDRMASRRLRATEWTQYHIDAFVPPGAVSISIKVKFYGNGTAFFDDITIKVLGKGRLAAEPPRAITGRGLENLVAFTKLYGYVRWFHPADQAAAGVDWNTLAVEGVRAVQSAGDAVELARRLEELFLSYAPTLQVYPAGSPPAEAPPVLEAGKRISRQMHIVYWKHRGLGTSYAPSRYYRSERTYEQARTGEVPEGVPDPRVPYEADLRGGVVCRIPTALFARRNKTLPQSRKQPPGFDEEVVNNGDDCATRIAAVVVAWNLFQHFFPALDRAEVDWTAELPGALRRAALASDTEAGIEVLERMIATTDDAFGRIIHPWRPHAGVEHLPIHWQWTEKRVVITAVAPGHPQVRVGDVVLELDGRDMQELVAKRVELQGASTPDYKMVRVLQSLRMGQVNSESRLLLQWGDAEPRTVTLKREPKFRNLRTRSTPAFSELEEGVYYIDLDRFKYAQIEKKLEHLVGARGIIIDYRGFVWGADLVGHFIDEPVQFGHISYALMTRPDQSDLELEKHHGLLAPRQPRLGAKLAFLIDARACGAPETVLTSVEHYKMGALVGTPTGGHNGMHNRVKVPGEYIVQWTGVKTRKQGGEPLLGNGVRPTVEVHRTVRGVMEGRDELLERAIEVVTEE